MYLFKKNQIIHLILASIIPFLIWGPFVPDLIVSKSLRSSMTEIATREPISLILRPEKSTLPIQVGRSTDPSATEILETKFS